jgi:hypothetical protein
MKTAHLFASALVVSLVGAAGCSSGKSTPTSSDYDNVAQTTSALVINASGGGEIGSMSATANLALGTTPLGVTANASGSFGTSTAGVDYTFDVSCTDSSGAALPHCGKTTNTAQANVTWSGNLQVPDITAAVSRQGDWTLSGLQTPTATFGGSGTFTFAANVQSIFAGGTNASLNLDYSATYNAVTISSGHATGGTIEYNVNATSDTSSANAQTAGNFSIDALVAFNPDGSATLTLDGSHTYTISAAGVVVKI